MLCNSIAWTNHTGCVGFTNCFGHRLTDAGRTDCPRDPIPWVVGHSTGLYWAPNWTSFLYRLLIRILSLKRVGGDDQPGSTSPKAGNRAIAGQRGWWGGGQSSPWARLHQIHPGMASPFGSSPGLVRTETGIGVHKYAYLERKR